jgi:hypothetical protein
MERALLDREEALRRVEADLQRARLDQRIRLQEMQKQLEKAKQVRSMPEVCNFFFVWWPHVACPVHFLGSLEHHCVPAH